MIRPPRRAVLWIALDLLCVLPAYPQTSAQMQAPPPPCATLETAPPCTPLAQTIATLLSDPAVVRDHWGIAVVSMDGTPIYSLHEGQLFQPASNAKLFTTAAAIHLLGGTQRFRTVLTGLAPSQTDGVLQGDLTLTGDGDANFAANDVPYKEPSDLPPPAASSAPLLDLEEMADAVAAAGVKRITGDIVASGGAFPWQPYPEDWSQDDLLWGYGAPVSGLSINDNQLKLTVTPGARPGDAASVTLYPAVPYYELKASVITVAHKAQSMLQVQRDPGSKVMHVSGTIPAGARAGVEQVAIEDPAEFAALALLEMLHARGIEVQGRARPVHHQSTETRSFHAQVLEPLPGISKAPVLGVTAGVSPEASCSAQGCPLQINHQSPTVLEDIVATNKDSLNLHAELLLRQLGLRFGEGEGTTAQGVRALRQFLWNAGLDRDDFTFFDGSGLSGHDLVTPRATVRLLQFASVQPWFAGWRSSLPVGGIDGSLQSRFTAAPLKGNVFAKTGTLGEARALSGYLVCASGRTAIFSIMVGNHLPQTHADRDAMDRIVAAIAASNECQ